LSVFSLPLTLLFLALAGAADVVSAVFRGTMLVERTPDSLRGRVLAVNIMVVTGGPRLGDLEAGLVAGIPAIGPAGSIVVGGLACLAGTAAVAAAFPSLRDYVAVPGATAAASSSPLSGPTREPETGPTH
ncbi:MAG: MFS transporter, partial [Actinomycetota bacterium]